MVARPEALYFYTQDGRAGCLALPGDKRLVCISAGLLLLVSASPAASVLGGSSPPGGPTSAGGGGAQQLSLYDLRSKLLAYQAPLAEFTHLLASAHTVTAFLQDGTAFALRERDTSSKVDLLVKRGLFPTALALLAAELAAAPDAPAAASASAAAADVRRLYGDHLYGKRDFDGALAQYIATIGSVPPSSVIRLFLEARRLGAVTTYLEALHGAGAAAPEHTTLLLHCYGAARDASKLDAFLAAAPPGGAEAYRQRFDVDTVLRVCRSAGYPAAALGVAARAECGAQRLAIMLDDLAQFDEALALLETLAPPEADEALQKYGRRLLAARPEATVALLLRGCGRARGAQGLARAAQQAHLFSEQPRQLLVRTAHACARCPFRALS